jgi:hypothetical protein
MEMFEPFLVKIDNLLHCARATEVLGRVKGI